MSITIRHVTCTNVCPDVSGSAADIGDGGLGQVNSQSSEISGKHDFERARLTQK